MEQLLLEYALNKEGKMIFTSEAVKSESYICPACQEEVRIRKPHLTEGQKYYKRPHFFHKNENKHCAESVLHQMFKERIAAHLKSRIADGLSCEITYNCTTCHHQHNLNILENVVGIATEHDLGEVIPDIALLDENQHLRVAIEIIYKHSPEKKALDYYSKHQIPVVCINVESFDELDKAESMLLSPSDVVWCAWPKCEQCGALMSKIEFCIWRVDCCKCGAEIKIALECFINKEIQFGLNGQNGLKMQRKYNEETRKTSILFTCKHCGAILGEYDSLGEFLKNATLVSKTPLGTTCPQCNE